MQLAARGTKTGFPALQRNPCGSPLWLQLHYLQTALFLVSLPKYLFSSHHCITSIFPNKTLHFQQPPPWFFLEIPLLSSGSSRLVSFRILPIPLISFQLSMALHITTEFCLTNSNCTTSSSNQISHKASQFWPLLDILKVDQIPTEGIGQAHQPTGNKVALKWIKLPSQPIQELLWKTITTNQNNQTAIFLNDMKLVPQRPSVSQCLPFPHVKPDPQMGTWWKASQIAPGWVSGPLS